MFMPMEWTDPLTGRRMIDSHPNHQICWDCKKEVVAEKDLIIATLREQIARGIEAKCVENRHQGNDDGMGALTSDPSVICYPETFRVCARCEVAAAIARGDKE